MISILGCFDQPYDARLLALAGFMCIVTCLTTVNQLSRARAIATHHRSFWLVAAAVVFGSGIWSMHFIAMMAYMPGLKIEYDLVRTGSSILVAIAGSAAAFMVWEKLGARPACRFLAALLLAAGIGGMHYEGVWAMRASSMVRLDWNTVAISAVLVVLIDFLFLTRSLQLRSTRRRVEAAFYLALAVLVLHFIGMSALTLVPGLGTTGADAIIGSGTLAIAVGAIGMAIVICGMAGVIMDQRMADRAEREAARLKQLADASFEGIAIHCDGVIRDCNKAFVRLVGRPREALIGHSALDFVAKKDLPRVLARIQNHREGGRLEFDFDIPGQAPRPVEVLSRPIDFHGRQAFVSAVRDLSERKATERKMRHLAHHDMLTGLCNRLSLSERLEQMIALAKRTNEHLAVLYLDLDRFKPVNDLLGHEAGDQLLIEVARRLKALTRTSDIVARVGGDEFVIVQPAETSPEGALASAERMIAALSAPFVAAGEEAVVGASIGVALYPAHGNTAEELLRSADRAMYHGKQTARGTACLFSSDIEQRLHERRVIERELRHAIERGELEVHYQPVFQCASSTIAGVEALVRWRHPEKGMIPPSDFIPVAEESGLICELGNWVLETACREVASWPGELRVAVNVSAAQFFRGDIVETVMHVLAAQGLAPDRLELEVTESLLIGDTAAILPRLAALRQQGVHLSLDDFGTGYSSLNYLHRYPFEKIKIDRSFINQLGCAEETEKIVGAIIALAKSLNMSVTAEGVETPAQLDLLRKLGCDLIQGYLLGKPQPGRAISKLVHSRCHGALPRNFPRAA